MEENAIGAIEAIAKGFQRLDNEGKNVSAILDALEFDGVRAAEVLLKMASGNKTLTDAIKAANEEWKANNALTREANLRYGTTGSKLKIAWNRVMQMANAFGEAMAPAIIQIVEWLEPLVDWFTKLDPKTKKIIALIGLLVAVIGPLLVVIGAVVAAVGALGTIGMAVFGYLTIAVGAVVAVAIILMKYFDKIKQFFIDLPKIVFGSIKIITDKFDEMTRKIMPDWLADWMPQGMIKKGIDVVYNQSSMVSDKSRADINLKVSSDQGTSVQIDNVNSKGSANVNIINDSYLNAAGLLGSY